MYVANQDGFSTQRKQGVGTCDYEMVNAFGVRIITNTNSRSMRHVDTICFIPGAAQPPLSTPPPLSDFPPLFTPPSNATPPFDPPLLPAQATTTR